MCRKELGNDKLIYDARSGRFYEKKIEEVCREEYCAIDETTGERLPLARPSAPPRPPVLDVLFLRVFERRSEVLEFSNSLDVFFPFSQELSLKTRSYFSLFTRFLFSPFF